MTQPVEPSTASAEPPGDEPEPNRPDLVARMLAAQPVASRCSDAAEEIFAAGFRGMHKNMEIRP
jgi:hypothetical protein